MNQVARKVKMKPGPPEGPSLPAGQVRHRDHHHTPRREQAAGLINGRGGLTQMLQRMPEHHTCPQSGPLVELLNPAGYDVITSINPLEAEGIASSSSQRGHERSLPRTHVEHRARRSDCVKPPRQAGPGKSQQSVATGAEATLGRPIPARIGVLELLVSRRRMRRRASARRAKGQSVTACLCEGPAPGTANLFHRHGR